jgi:hypothetical protein
MGKRNTIHKHPEAKHTTESLIKITGTIPRNTERTVANTTQGNCTKHKKRHENKKAKKGKPTHCQHPTLS